jgi:hypothetical protein
VVGGVSVVGVVGIAIHARQYIWINPAVKATADPASSMRHISQVSCVVPRSHTASLARMTHHNVFDQPFIVAFFTSNPAKHILILNYAA